MILFKKQMNLVLGRLEANAYRRIRQCRRSNVLLPRAR